MTFFTVTHVALCDSADTRKVRDACIVERGQDSCVKEIDAHKVCLRIDGFDVK